MKKVAKKAKKVSVIGRGKFAKFYVFSGKRKHTVGGLEKDDLTRNKSGKIVSKKSSARAKKSKWIAACVKARAALKVQGFSVIGGNTPEGKALLAKAHSFYKK